MEYMNFRLEPVKTADAPAEEKAADYFCDDTPRIRQWRAERAAVGGYVPSADPGDTHFLHADLGRALRENEAIKDLIANGRGTAVLKIAPEGLLTRTVLTSGGLAPAPERIPGITPEPRRRLRVQDLLTTIPTNSAIVEWITVNSHAKVVSPQTEGAIKAENEITFQKHEARVRTIATWMPASKQILEDFDGLEAFLRSSLTYAVAEEFEDQLLFGSGAGENLHGLVTQAVPFDTSLLGTSWTRIDVIGRAIHQLAAANELPPTFAVLHPADFWDLALEKDAQGRYLIANPQDPRTVTSLFNLLVVTTSAMSPGTFLLGTSDPRGAQIRMRQPLTVEISTEHADYFARNLVAIRAELRAALVVMRPGAFIKGSLTSSPA
jgi:HK97 family phage major capsid protein